MSNSSFPGLQVAVVVRVGQNFGFMCDRNGVERFFHRGDIGTAHMWNKEAHIVARRSPNFSINDLPLPSVGTEMAFEGITATDKGFKVDRWVPYSEIKALDNLELTHINGKGLHAGQLVLARPEKGWGLVEDSIGRVFMIHVKGRRTLFIANSEVRVPQHTPASPKIPEVGEEIIFGDFQPPFVAEQNPKAMTWFSFKEHARLQESVKKSRETLKRLAAEEETRRARRLAAQNSGKKARTAS